MLAAACVATLALAGCTAEPAPTPTAARSPSPPVSSGATSEASPTPTETSEPPTSAPSPASHEGVVPADPDAFASVVANSVVAVIAAGHVDFIDRILGDAQSSSTCAPFPSIKVLEKSELDGEDAYVRKVVRVARAHEGIDGVGTARAKMQPGVEWPGVKDPFVVDVILAIDCPGE
jgi:hypothetical protein